MKDTYQTRKNNYHSIIKRKEKVSYKKPNEITQQDFEHYNTNGFVIIKNFFDSNIINKVKKECYYLYDNNYNYYVNKEPNTGKVRSILSVHNNKVISLLLNNKLIDMSNAILGDKTYIHQSRINYKAGKDTNGWNWHSDFETWHAKDGMPKMRCFTAMIAMDENTKENGCVNFLPKSHNHFISCPYVGEVDPEKEFSEQIEGVPAEHAIAYLKNMYNENVYSAECSTGDLLLFDCNTLHYSAKNSTENRRTNIYFVFNSIKNKLVKPFNSELHRPEAMATIIKNTKK